MKILRIGNSDLQISDYVEEYSSDSSEEEDDISIGCLRKRRENTKLLQRIVLN